jgi:hypothetical protein
MRGIVLLRTKKDREIEGFAQRIASVSFTWGRQRCRRFFREGELARNQTKKVTSQGGDHVRDGVIEGDAAIQVRLPIFGQEAKIIFPAAFVQALAHGVGDVSGS